jgi:hypothetical protein
MVRAAGHGQQHNESLGDTFSLFEPCHVADSYEPWLKAAGCQRLLSDLTNCNFDGVNDLWGWRNSHTTNKHKQYSSLLAHKLCSKSQLVAFKTVNYGHNLSDFRSFLEQQPDLRILDVVRDPRGIYASWLSTEPFKHLVGKPDYYTLPEVCESFLANLELRHPMCIT